MDGKREKFMYLVTLYYNKDPQRETKITAHLTWKKKS
jgi:hypothetical protein